MKPPGDLHWWWGCNVYGQPQEAKDRGARDQFQGLPASFQNRVDEDQGWAQRRRHFDRNTARPDTGRHNNSNVAAQPNLEELRDLENSRAAPRQRVFKAGSIELAADNPLRGPEHFGDRCRARGRKSGGYSGRIQSPDLRQYRQTPMPGGLGQRQAHWRCVQAASLGRSAAGESNGLAAWFPRPQSLEPGQRMLH